MRLIGADPGRHKTKIWYGGGHFEFHSNLGEYRESEFDDEVGEDDLVIKYRGNTLTGGTLALRESEYGETMMTDSKLHQDTVILILVALHKAFPSSEVGLVTGLPVKDHSKDKKELIRMMNGFHEITVNDVTKQFRVRCSVAPEGSCFFKAARQGATIRGLQIGSRTVNAITFRDGKKIGKESDTFDFGTESGKNRDSLAMARAIAAKTGALKWKRDDKVYICGGGATKLYNDLFSYYPNTKLVVNPIFSDAEAFYYIAREIYG